MTDLLLASIVGGIISLDRTAFLQIMVSQPLIASTLVGLSLGDPVAGLTIGCIMELLWIAAVPVGSSVPPNETAASVIATSVSIIGGREIGAHQLPPMPMMVLSVLLSIPLAVVAQRIDIGVRNFNRRFVLNADRLFESGNLYGIGKENLKGLLSFFAASFFSLLALTAVGLIIANHLYPLVPAYFIKGLSIASYFLISLGIAVSVRTAKGKRLAPIFSAGIMAGIIFIYFI